MNDDDRITAKNQGRAQNVSARDAFLRGVMDESNNQGYSAHSKGRLFVVALREWEGR